jgi:four helix bundle protein
VSEIRRFEDLIAWQKARVLARSIYELTNSGRFARDFALRNQLWRGAVSIMSNIAEGFERNRLAEFHQFLSVAKASCAEVRSQLYVAHDAGHIDAATLQNHLRLAEEVARIIGGLRRSVEAEITRLRSLRTQDPGLRTASLARLKK